MKQSTIIAGALVWSCALAVSSHPKTVIVDIQMTADHAQPAEVIYETVLKKAEDTCGRDTSCQEEMVAALVETTGNEAVKAVHKSNSAEPVLVAASDRD